VSLQACLNGPRAAAEHPAVPITPAQLAVEAVAAVAAGADGLHLHPRSGSGGESLAGEAVAAALTAVRDALRAADAGPVDVGVTTAAWAAPDAGADPGVRHAAVAGWPVWPDSASVNWHEDGAEALAALLIGHGVGVEAGLWTVRAATAYLTSPLRPRVRRILVEATDDDPEASIATAASIVSLLRRAGVRVPLLVHGENAGAWPVLRWAAVRGFTVRVGLEDVLTLPDGGPAPDNAGLVACARRLVER
jgi:uncharacterized protein (DUF849 family)